VEADLARLAARISALRLPRRRRPAGSALRVGLDLVEVDAVSAMLDSRFASRYLARVYTNAEVRDCTQDRGIDAARLAGRFAAKEAVMKMLDVGDSAVPWRAVEVRRERSGCPAIVLHGAAAGLAEREGISRFAVSLSHEAGYAAAVVVGTP
jgi:holo-[acyl-carrier protein] synthase